MTTACPACVDGTCLECDGDGCGTCDNSGDCPDCDGAGTDDDPHADCILPHGNAAGGYYDCDGRPI